MVLRHGATLGPIGDITAKHAPLRLAPSDASIPMRARGEPIMTNKTLMMLAASVCAIAVVGAGVADAREGRVRARGENGVVTGAVGPSGGATVRGRGAVQNPDGSVTAGSAGAVRTPAGNAAVRASTTTVNPDGSAVRRSGFAAQGANGASAVSEGTTTRNADGTYDSTRNTQATTATGNTYQGTTTYDPTTGVTRSTTCTDASGATIACPR
jgi:hypothetical protein